MEFMKCHDFKLVNLDTDSIMFSKQDESPFSKEEIVDLIDEINSELPEMINFADDGYFQKVIIFKAKNYILWDGKKIKVKGSALKSATLEIGFREFIDEIVQAMLNDNTNYLDIYHKYVTKVMNITTKEEMKKFSSKKGLSNTTFSSERTNETKILEAIQGTEYVVGDKVWLFFTSDDNLCLAENFVGDYNKAKLLEKLYKVTARFETVIDTSIFLNYKLKKNKELLNDFNNKTNGLFLN